jgi:hypothetical protein
MLLYKAVFVGLIVNGKVLDVKLLVQGSRCVFRLTTINEFIYLTLVINCVDSARFKGDSKREIVHVCKACWGDYCSFFRFNCGVFNANVDVGNLNLNIVYNHFCIADIESLLRFATCCVSLVLFVFVPHILVNSLFYLC